jgi:hypothetical protein
MTRKDNCANKQIHTENHVQKSDDEKTKKKFGISLRNASMVEESHISSAGEESAL